MLALTTPNESAQSRGKALGAVHLVTTPTPPHAKDDDDGHVLAFDARRKVRYQ